MTTRKCMMCDKEYHTDQTFIMHLGADHQLAPITFVMTPHYIECFDKNSDKKEGCD